MTVLCLTQSMKKPYVCTLSILILSKSAKNGVIGRSPTTLSAVPSASAALSLTAGVVSASFYTLQGRKNTLSFIRMTKRNIKFVRILEP